MYIYIFHIYIYVYIYIYIYIVCVCFFQKCRINIFSEKTFLKTCKTENKMT